MGSVVVLSALHDRVFGAGAFLYPDQCAPDLGGVLGAEGCALRDALAADAEASRLIGRGGTDEQGRYAGNLFGTGIRERG